MFSKWSLKVKLLVLICTLSGTTFAFMSVLAFRSEHALEDGKAVQVRAATESLMDKIDRNLFERYGDVQAFALSQPARSGNPAQITEFMNDMMGVYAPVYDLMIVTDTKGRAIAVNGIDKAGKPIDTRFIIGKDYSSETWFQKAINGEIKEATSFVEDLHIDVDVAKVVGNAGQAMNFTAPIRDKKTGTILGVWTNRMSWTDVVVAIVKEEAEKIKSDRIVEVFSYLVDAKGRFLLHPEGKDYELTKNLEHFEAIKQGVKDHSTVVKVDLRTSYFSDEVWRVTTASKGYGSYPSQGWYAMIDVPFSDNQVAFNIRLIVLSVLFQIFGIGLSVWVVRGVSQVFTRVVTQLRGEGDQVKVAASNINGASQSLAQSATQQASALQETAASIEEISAMVKKSSENASKSREVANTSHEVATRGKQTVQNMVEAISEIDQSNANIMKQVEESNKQITEIVKVITEIGNKTKVINDIVFQTKLLSFNASVEAARAGEHGKGFAVVAEEVGNLAQMSGNASKEISEMLNGSIQKVEGIVNETKSKVEKLISVGKEKVETGTVIAKQCGEILEEVVQNVSEVNAMIGEISTASHEQAQGISEITKAMNQMDQVTHENAASSQQAASSSEQLFSQSESLLNVVLTLEQTVNGARQYGATFSQSPLVAQPGISHPKVISLETARKSMSAPEKHSGVESKVKKASGTDFIPSETDPRFKDL